MSSVRPPSLLIILLTLEAASCGTGDSSGASGNSGAGDGGGSSSESGASSSEGGRSGTDGSSGNAGSPGSSGSSGNSAGSGTSSGSSGNVGSSGSAGSSGSSGGSGTTSDSGSADSSGSPGNPPGDIANASGVAVAAAHSMTRALFAAYGGKLFQVSRASDGQTKDIGLASTGGRVDLSTLDSFCSTTCGISVLYDQTGNGNDLKQTSQRNMPTVAMWTTKGGTSLPYALTQNSAGAGAIGGDSTGQYLRNRNQTKKIPTGSAPQTEYMVVYAKYYRGHCCYDYGNMESGIRNDGPGTMNALYFGQTKDWTWGAANGPWAMVDMEDGVFSFGGKAGNVNPSNGNPAGQNTGDPAFMYPGANVVAVLSKTNGTSTFVLKVGDMEQGGFTTAWNGALPNGYAPLRQEGGLSLGEGGDGSDNVDGAFFEGVVVAGEESDASDGSIQTDLNRYFTQ